MTKDTLKNRNFNTYTLRSLSLFSVTSRKKYRSTFQTYCSYRITSFFIIPRESATPCIHPLPATRELHVYVYVHTRTHTCAHRIHDRRWTDGEFSRRTNELTCIAFTQAGRPFCPKYRAPGNIRSAATGTRRLLHRIDRGVEIFAAMKTRMKPRKIDSQQGRRIALVGSAAVASAGKR